MYFTRQNKHEYNWLLCLRTVTAWPTLEHYDTINANTTISYHLVFFGLAQFPPTVSM